MEVLIFIVDVLNVVKTLPMVEVVYFISYVFFTTVLN